MELPAFDLPTTAGGRLANADLAGRPWYIYAARHPGCFVCQHALGEALSVRDELRQQGGDMIVFFNSKVEYTTAWAKQSDLPQDLTIAIDPDAMFYEALGTIRGGLVDQTMSGLGQLWRARNDIRKWRLTNNDMLRMGADVGVAPDGQIAFKHICRNPEDRADPRAVIAALASAAA